MRVIIECVVCVRADTVSEIRTEVYMVIFCIDRDVNKAVGGVDVDNNNNLNTWCDEEDDEMQKKAKQRKVSKLSYRCEYV